MRAILKKMALITSRYSGLFALARNMAQPGLRILAYHGVEDGLNPVVNFDGFMVASGVFESHLERLGKTYRIEPLSEMLAALCEHKAIPRNAVAITFDDGYANYLDVVAPMLERYGFPATFFVTTGFLDGTAYPWWFRLRSHLAQAENLPVFKGAPAASRAATEPGERIRAILEWESSLKNLSNQEREARLSDMNAPARVAVPRMLDWSRLRALARRGFDIGPHSVSHASVPHEPAHGRIREIASSAVLLRREIPGMIPCFSFPYGQPENCTQDFQSVFSSAELTSALSDQPGLNRPGDNLFALKRYAINGKHSADALDAVVSGFKNWVSRT